MELNSPLPPVPFPSRPTIIPENPSAGVVLSGWGWEGGDLNEYLKNIIASDVDTTPKRLGGGFRGGISVNVPEIAAEEVNGRQLSTPRSQLRSSNVIRRNNRKYNAKLEQKERSQREKELSDLAFNPVNKQVSLSSGGKVAADVNSTFQRNKKRQDFGIIVEYVERKSQQDCSTKTKKSSGKRRFPHLIHSLAEQNEALLSDQIANQILDSFSGPTPETTDTPEEKSCPTKPSALYLDISASRDHRVCKEEYLIQKYSPNSKVKMRSADVTPQVESIEGQHDAVRPVPQLDHTHEINFGKKALCGLGFLTGQRLKQRHVGSRDEPSPYIIANGISVAPTQPPSSASVSRGNRIHSRRTARKNESPFFCSSINPSDEVVCDRTMEDVRSSGLGEELMNSIPPSNPQDRVLMTVELEEVVGDEIEERVDPPSSMEMEISPKSRQDEIPVPVNLIPNAVAGSLPSEEKQPKLAVLSQHQPLSPRPAPRFKESTLLPRYRRKYSPFQMSVSKGTVPSATVVDPQGEAQISVTVRKPVTSPQLKFTLDYGSLELQEGSTGNIANEYAFSMGEQQLDGSKGLAPTPDLHELSVYEYSQEDTDDDGDVEYL